VTPSARTTLSARRFANDERCRFRSTVCSGVRVVARLTARCNFRCPHCLAAASPQLPIDTLAVESWCTILRELPEIGAVKLLLTGGEPLLFPGLVKLTSYVSGLGISTDLNSNLWQLTPQLAAELVHAGLTEVSVSLQGPDVVHDAMHGQTGARRRLLWAVRLFQDAGIPVDGSLCVTPANLVHVLSTIQEAADLRLASFTVSACLPHGHGRRSRGDLVPPPVLAGLHRRIGAARQEGLGLPVRCVGLLGPPHLSDCGLGDTIIGVLPSGAITPCPLSGEPIGSVSPLESGLREAVGVMREEMVHRPRRLCRQGKE